MVATSQQRVAPYSYFQRAQSRLPLSLPLLISLNFILFCDSSSWISSDAATQPRRLQTAQSNCCPSSCLVLVRVEVHEQAARQARETSPRGA